MRPVTLYSWLGEDARRGRGPVQPCNPSNIEMCEPTLSTCGDSVTAPIQEGRGHQA